MVIGFGDTPSQHGGVVSPSFGKNTTAQLWKVTAFASQKSVLQYYVLDYRVLNLTTTRCVEVFGSFPGEQWTHTLLERAKPVTTVRGFLVWAAVTKGSSCSIQKPPACMQEFVGACWRGFFQGERGRTPSMVVPRVRTPTKRRTVWGSGTSFACYFVGSIKCS